MSKSTLKANMLKNQKDNASAILYTQQLLAQKLARLAAEKAGH